MKTKSTRSRLSVKLALGAALALGFHSAAGLGAAEGVSPLVLAQGAFDRGDLAAAAAHLQPLADAVRPDPAALDLLAQIRLRQGQAAQAVDLLERADSFGPNNARRLCALGQALGRRLGEVSLNDQGVLAERMLEVLQRAVELDPDLVDGWMGLAMYCANAPEFAGGGQDLAVQYAGEVAKRVPWLGEFACGQIEFIFENNEGARAHFARADELNPGQAWLQAAHGRALARLGRNDEARAQLEAALKLDPNFEPAKTALAALTAPPAPPQP